MAGMLTLVALLVVALLVYNLLLVHAVRWGRGERRRATLHFELAQSAERGRCEAVALLHAAQIALDEWENKTTLVVHEYRPRWERQSMAAPKNHLEFDYGAAYSDPRQFRVATAKLVEHCALVHPLSCDCALTLQLLMNEMKE